MGAGFDSRPELVATASEANELEDDLEFLARAAIKLVTIRGSLGRVGTVLAAKVERAMIGETTTLDASIDDGPEQALLAAEKKLRDAEKKMAEGDKKTAEAAETLAEA